ncbi:hypothetical protein AB205_0056050 [Aquarana catesbeiana]|uniref:Uncharacterized protein n=1 Tax=Aquarana catesbeiana TaxID=8400 RepID=A0A2G9SH31_AQUCT|nr:hypothetical protein AB205_0056050 [Aquarana catesbeiana]
MRQPLPSPKQQVQLLHHSALRLPYPPGLTHHSVGSVQGDRVPGVTAAPLRPKWTPAVAAEPKLYPSPSLAADPTLLGSCLEVGTAAWLPALRGSRRSHPPTRGARFPVVRAAAERPAQAG